MIGWFGKKQPEKKCAQAPRIQPAAQSKAAVCKGAYGNWNDLVVSSPPPRAQSISMSTSLDPVLMVRKTDKRLQKPNTSKQWNGSTTTERHWRAT